MVDELDGGWFVGVVGTAVHVQAVDAVFVDALYSQYWISICVSFLGCSRGEEGDTRVVGREWCRSSWTLGGRRRLPGRRNMLLQKVNILASAQRRESRIGGNIPAPRPFSPFSNSSRSLKLRGTLAPILLVGSACEAFIELNQTGGVVGRELQLVEEEVLLLFR